VDFFEKECTGTAHRCIGSRSDTRHSCAVLLNLRFCAALFHRIVEVVPSSRGNKGAIAIPVSSRCGHYQLLGTHWLPLATALGTHAATSLKGQYAPNNHTVGGTLALRHGLRIDIHRALDGGVPEQLLLDFDVGTYSAQQA